MSTAKKLLKEHEYFAETEHLVDVEGMSTPRVCNFLNRLVGEMNDDEVYLEIGTWKGLTLCSAAYRNRGKRCIACDKFRLFGKFTGLGFRAKRSLYRNVERHSVGGASVEFHHMNSTELASRNLVPKNVAVYFYDGDHTFEGTKANLVNFADKLADTSTLLVDDYNDPNIRRATEDALLEMNVDVEWHEFLKGENGSQGGWWNGLGVFTLRRRA